MKHETLEHIRRTRRLVLGAIILGMIIAVLVVLMIYFGSFDSPAYH